MTHDLREILRLCAGRHAIPSTLILDGHTLQSTPESGGRAGYNGYKHHKGPKVHTAVDTLGHLLTLKATAANEQERDQVGELAAKVQEATGQSVKLADVDQGYTGDCVTEAANVQEIELMVVKLPQVRIEFCIAAQTVGGGAELRLGREIQAYSPRLRTIAPDAGGTAPAGVCLPHARQDRALAGRK